MKSYYVRNNYVIIGSVSGDADKEDNVKDDVIETISDDEIQTDDKIQNKKPRAYRIIMHNDNYTTMEFVVAILIEIFHKTETDAITLMLSIHKKGKVIVGKYPKEIAEMKIQMATDRARVQEYPLKITMEPV